MNTTFDIREALDDLAGDTLPSSPDLAPVALRRARRRRFAARGAVAFAAFAVVVPVTMGIVSQSGPFRTTLEPAGPSNAAAQHAASDPRHLLLDDQVWRISYADSLAYESGEITMTDGERQFELRWWPGDDYESLLDDRRADGEQQESFSLLGHDAMLFSSAGTFYTVWLDEELSLEARGDGFDDRADYMSVLATLHEADEDTWRAALPDDTVFAEERADVVAEMLRDIPTPDGLDTAPIATADVTESRYHVGVTVTRSVMCAWADEWIAATESGDDEAAGAAAEAITSAYDWPILQEMEPQGGWSQSMWDGADVFADGLSPVEVAQIYGDDEQAADPDPPLEVYRAPFGCDQ